MILEFTAEIHPPVVKSPNLHVHIQSWEIIIYWECKEHMYNHATYFIYIYIYMSFEKDMFE